MKRQPDESYIRISALIFWIASIPSITVVYLGRVLPRQLYRLFAVGDFRRNDQIILLSNQEKEVIDLYQRIILPVTEDCRKVKT